MGELEQESSFEKFTGSESWPLINELSDFLTNEGIDSYLVGGWLRDRLLGRDTNDIDIAVASDALDIASKVAKVFKGTYVPLDRDNKIARVVLTKEENSGPAVQIDFSTIDGNIESDLGRRDFTIDAMAVNLGKGADKQIIDPFSGQDDLQMKIVRAVTETVFSADPVRLLRAVRLAADLDFKIDTNTEALIRNNVSLISGVAGERVREELLRLLSVSDGGVLKYLDKLELLTSIFPELTDTKGVTQPKEHFWNVFEHSLRAVDAVDFLLRRGSWEFGGGDVLASVPWSEELALHFDNEVSSGSNRRTLLKLAALLHDINKPQTKALDENGRTRFIGHPQEGSETVVKMLERLRFSSKETKLVEIEVLHHMRPTQMSQFGMPTNRAIYRYFRDTGEAGIDILFLNLADHLATRGPGLISEGWMEHGSLVNYVINKRYEQEIIVRSPKLIDGYDIINKFRVPAGPEVGSLLEAVLEAQASGEITTREEALSLIERLKKKNV